MTPGEVSLCPRSRPGRAATPESGPRPVVSASPEGRRPASAQELLAPWAGSQPPPLVPTALWPSAGARQKTREHEAVVALSHSRPGVARPGSQSRTAPSVRALSTWPPRLSVCAGQWPPQPAPPRTPCGAGTVGGSSAEAPVEALRAPCPGPPRHRLCPGPSERRDPTWGEAPGSAGSRGHLRVLSREARRPAPHVDAGVSTWAR